MRENSATLITDGTGSFGHIFVPMAVAKYSPKSLVIFSRDEMKQWEMAELFQDDPRVRFFVGAVRINGVPGHPDRLHNWRVQIGYVSQ